MPEKLIAEKLGHRSVETLWMYEHTASELQERLMRLFLIPASFNRQMDKQELEKKSSSLSVITPSLSSSLPGFLRIVSSRSTSRTEGAAKIQI